MTTRTPDMTAFEAALRQYAVAHDVWAEREQIELVKGHDIEAAGAHGYAYLVLRAYIAEKDDPAPRYWP